ncbi:uncharacterized protein LOC141620085 [Silene latifolia]|uniref:uncharacterized protein LOC141620085 n=1 Tax=Silene latifolia TaxID=37657 RepID=UPI003D785587
MDHNGSRLPTLCSTLPQLPDICKCTPCTTLYAIYHDITLAFFLTWGIEIIGKVNPSGSGGHCFILVAIDYFTKWVEAKSYKVLKAKQVAQFIQNEIIFRYRTPHELISDNMTHFQAEMEAIFEKYKIKHHKSSPYTPQTNEAVEAANKTLTAILRKMSDNYKD